MKNAKVLIRAMEEYYERYYFNKLFIWLVIFTSYGTDGLKSEVCIKAVEEWFKEQ